jgi:hypothetical protein
MRRYLGTVLIVISVICILATLFSIWWGITHPSQHPSEDRRKVEALSSAIILGVLGILESLLIILGLYLRRPLKPKSDDGAEVHENRRLLPFAIYLGGSIGVAILGSLSFLRHINIGPLEYLVIPPSILFQFAFVFGPKLGPGITRNVLLVVFHIVYFTAMLYPVYRIVTLDRALDRVRIKRMKMILALFCSLHLLVLLFLLVVGRA